MREIWFAVAIALTMAGAVPPAGAAAAAPPPAAGKAKAGDVLAVKPGDRILGDPKAPITIVEYASLSCPHCAHFENTVLPTIQKEWIDTGKAKLIMRDFPLDRAALRAEMLARCVPPGRYYPLVKTLFATQDEWVLAKDQEAALERIAKLAGIGQKQAEACLADKQLENAVAQSRLTASQQLGVDATPTFFINGKKFEGEPTVVGFNQLLSGIAAKEKS